MNGHGCRNRSGQFAKCGSGRASQRAAADKTHVAAFLDDNGSMWVKTFRNESDREYEYSLARTLGGPRRMVRGKITGPVRDWAVQQAGTWGAKKLSLDGKRVPLRGRGHK